MDPRLITIRYSHYCEKARWTLDHHRIRFTEEPHVPVLAWRATFGARGRRTVPVLVTSDTVLPDSTDILRWADAHGRSDAPLLPPDSEAASLEDHFDDKLGPAARRLAYFYVLPDPAVRELLLSGDISPWERRVGRVALPLITGLIKRGLRIDPAGAERSRQVVDRIFGEVEQRLSDGRRYLTGDRFTAADLTFAALSSPLLMPDTYESFASPLGAFGPTVREMAERHRRTKAGAFALRVYAEDRTTFEPQARGAANPREDGRPGSPRPGTVD